MYEYAIYVVIEARIVIMKRTNPMRRVSFCSLYSHCKNLAGQYLYRCCVTRDGERMFMLNTDICEGRHLRHCGSRRRVSALLALAATDDRYLARTNTKDAAAAKHSPVYFKSLG